ncbi:hypothetical protein CEUSTIGMA_g1832.t1 [Chlamydomonas eustigma]|uniref:Uncharacterized protein n=1 Tax=Chlamydomonas eustigma TaxID=1157962 RepID=A0A250WU94_9CHLO|nr:hypothetical protein CEUSTIGMA_g1832.t1 [Chlamydomonas eustigma]|eukprot:GAX74384.1 hypothetical protein CEUSTIGMA_g1832.t1 [Chlamydomonas eustigma]
MMRSIISNYITTVQMTFGEPAVQRVNNLYNLQLSSDVQAISRFPALAHPLHLILELTGSLKSTVPLKRLKRLADEQPHFIDEYDEVFLTLTEPLSLRNAASQIQRLHLKGFRPGVPGLAALVASAFPSLRSLVLQPTNVSSTEPILLGGLSSLANLESIHIRTEGYHYWDHVSATDSRGPVINGLKNLDGLKQLEVGRCCLEGLMMGHIPSLSGLVELRICVHEELYPLSPAAGGDGRLGYVDVLCQLVHLRHLSIKATPGSVLSTAAALQREEVLQLCRLSQLTCLELPCMQLGVTREDIRLASHTPDTTESAPRYGRINRDHLEAVEALGSLLTSLPRLHTLTVDKVSLADETKDLMAFQDSMRCLEIANKQPDDDGAKQQNRSFQLLRTKAIEGTAVAVATFLHGFAKMTGFQARIQVAEEIPHTTYISINIVSFGDLERCFRADYPVGDPRQFARSYSAANKEFVTFLLDNLLSKLVINTKSSSDSTDQNQHASCH